SPRATKGWRRKWPELIHIGGRHGSRRSHRPISGCRAALRRGLSHFAWVCLTFRANREHFELITLGKDSRILRRARGEKCSGKITGPDPGLPALSGSFRNSWLPPALKVRQTQLRVVLSTRRSK